MTFYLELEDFIDTAAEVLGLAADTVAKAARLELAESALHAPRALTCMVRFCLRNGYEYVPPAGDDPDGEETFQRMLAIAAAPADDLEPIEAETAEWIAERLRPRPQP